MNIREIRQNEAAHSYLFDSDHRSIINACPRFGKIRTAISIMKELRSDKILLLMPRNDIWDGWNNDFHDTRFRPSHILKSTFTSIGKIKKDDWDLVIIDEPHELSINQQEKLAPIIENQKVLGLTGTMTQKTRNELYDNLTLDVCYKYTINQGVDEGILTDYDMYIHQVRLDNKKPLYRTSKGRSYTEKGYFDLYTYIRKDAKMKHFIDMKLINIIQNSYSKMMKTKELLGKFSRERVLVFCGVTKVADNLGIPVYHSKKKEEEIFSSFCGGVKYNQLATIKMMQAGITVLPINKGIINYMSGNPEDSAQKICRFLGFEYDNPEKKAEIHIISTDEVFETDRLKTGLLFFDDRKIHHITP